MRLALLALGVLALAACGGGGGGGMVVPETCRDSGCNSGAPRQSRNPLLLQRRPCPSA